ncbi:MAG: 50S ribosomal protein L4 [Thermoflavifilum sp.]|nr:50S ribosomal protein L4 [Thermoflavifilum sp.]
MQLEVLNIQGEKTGRMVELPDAIFAAKPHHHVLYLAVKQYLAAQRQGTHKTKTRNEVKGSTRKLHRQKGTGGSRKGSIRNPLYRGGGTVFGPQPRDYTLKLNKKEKDLARVSAFSIKASEGAIRIVEDFQIQPPRTKQFVNVLEALGIDAEMKKVLFVTPDYQESLFLSFRNIPTVNGSAFKDVHTYDILNANYLVFTEQAARLFQQAQEPVEAE